MGNEIIEGQEASVQNYRRPIRRDGVRAEKPMKGEPNSLTHGARGGGGITVQCDERD